MAFSVYKINYKKDPTIRYNGYTKKSVQQRVREHKSGYGAAITRKLNKYEIDSYISCKKFNTRQEATLYELYETILDYGFDFESYGSFLVYEKEKFTNKQKDFLDMLFKWTQDGFESFKKRIYIFYHLTPEDSYSLISSTISTRSNKNFILRFLSHLKDNCFKCYGDYHFACDCENKKYKYRKTTKKIDLFDKVVDVFACKIEELESRIEELESRI